MVENHANAPSGAPAGGLMGNVVMPHQDGVLLVGHGTVTDLADLPEFLRRIRRGRAATEELLREVADHYRAIGGSPLLAVSAAQADALAGELDLPVVLGMRMWEPTIENALRAAATRGIARLCVMPLAPFSVGVYSDAVDEALKAIAGSIASPPELLRVAPWGTAPELVTAHAEAIRPALAGLPHDRTQLVLSAHSLPVEVIDGGDPYAREFEAMAHAVLERLGRPGRIAYQSQGASGGRWLGPTLRETLEASAQDGMSHVVLAPAGFLADHVETLYDLDIQAAGWATELGLTLVRVRALNVDERLTGALAATVRRAFAAADEGRSPS